MCIECVLRLSKFRDLQLPIYSSITPSRSAFQCLFKRFRRNYNKGREDLLFAAGQTYRAIFQFRSHFAWQEAGCNPFSVRPRDSFAPVFHRSPTERTHDNWIVNPIKRNGLSRLRKRSRSKHTASRPLSENIMMLDTTVV